jgi:tetratricopeptide (TPR) repeat protein
MERWDRYAECLRLAESGLEVATRLGHGSWRLKFVAGQIGPLAWMGRWDEAVAAGRELIEGDLAVEVFDIELIPLVWVSLARGDHEAAGQILRRFEESKQEEIQLRAAMSAGTAAFLRAEGRPREALEAARQGIEVRRSLGATDMPTRVALVEGIEAALELADLEEAERLLAIAEAPSPGERSPMLEAARARLWAGLLIARGGDEREIERSFRAAEEGFVAIESSFWMATSQAEHGEWLAAQGRSKQAASLLSSALKEFERLKATPWIERVSRALGVEAKAVGAAEVAPA